MREAQYTVEHRMPREHFENCLGLIMDKSGVIRVEILEEIGDNVYKIRVFGDCEKIFAQHKTVLAHMYKTDSILAETVRDNLSHYYSFISADDALGVLGSKKAIATATLEYWSEIF